MKELLRLELSKPKNLDTTENLSMINSLEVEQEQLQGEEQGGGKNSGTIPGRWMNTSTMEGVEV